MNGLNLIVRPINRDRSDADTRRFLFSLNTSASSTSLVLSKSNTTPSSAS